ncbi:MAG: hypothetical protein JWM59_537 [Verrucomicrobiales bacterium]|nr:hypothetical protein [Verrucomicrobiales bacterium]
MSGAVTPLFQAWETAVAAHSTQLKSNPPQRTSCPAPPPPPFPPPPWRWRSPCRHWPPVSAMPSQPAHRDHPGNRLKPRPWQRPPPMPRLSLPPPSLKAPPGFPVAVPRLEAGDSFLPLRTPSSHPPLKRPDRIPAGKAGEPVCHRASQLTDWLRTPRHHRLSLPCHRSRLSHRFPPILLFLLPISPPLPHLNLIIPAKAAKAVDETAMAAGPAR